MNQTKSNNSFFEAINDIPSDTIYIQNELQTLTYGEIYSLIENFSKEHNYLEGKNCALLTSSRYELAKYLPMVASLASKIYLQPSCLNKETVQEFYEKSEIEYVVNITNTEVDINEIYVSQQDKNVDQEWLLSTSGTSGTPKLLSYSLDRLTLTSKKNAKRGSEFSWGLCYDLNRFAGLQVYFQAISSGSSLTIVEASSDQSDIVKLFADKRINCLSGTPSFWRKILMTQGSNDIDFKRITLGGEIADQAILSSLRKVFTSSKISHIYASTEAGVGFSVQDSLAGFPLEYLKSTNQLGIELKIIDDVLWIKSNGSARNILSGNLIIDEEGFINTGDIVEIKDKRVFFVGRDSGAINVGGNKFIPEEVEAILNDAPEVLQAKVFGKKNSVLGMLVNAEIVAQGLNGIEQEKALKKKLILLCKSKLEPFKVPAVFKFVKKIAVNESGKIVRKS